MSKFDCQYCKRGKLKDCDFINDDIFKNKIKQLETKLKKICRDRVKVIIENERLEKENKKLKKLLLPLANLDLTGVQGDVVYRRNDTFIIVDDILKAKEILKVIE